MSYPPQPPYAPRPQSDPYYPPPPTTSAAAIVSLICGILGCVPFLTGIIAVITGIIGITVTQRPNVRGTGMAIAGLILGILSLLGWGLFGFGAGMLYIKTGPEREAARLFMTHVADGKFDDAQAEATDQVTKDQLTDANSQIAIWGGMERVRVLVADFNDVNGQASGHVTGWIVSPDQRPHVFQLVTVQQGGIWKISHVSLTPSNSSPPPTP